MTNTPSTDPAPVDEGDEIDEPTAFAYTPDDRMHGPVVLDEASWKRFCEVAGLNLDGSPREDPPTD